MRGCVKPSRPVVPGNPIGLTVIIGIFDRCGDCGSPLSATGSAKRAFSVSGEGCDPSSVTRLAGDRRLTASPQVNDDEIGESRLRENLRSDTLLRQKQLCFCFMWTMGPHEGRVAPRRIREIPAFSKALLCWAQLTLCIFSLLLKLKIESRNYDGTFLQEYLSERPNL